MPISMGYISSLTADEKEVLFYIGNHSPLRIDSLRDIPFYHALFERFEIALHGLAKKGCIILSRTEAIYKKDAP